ncbi:E-NPP family protein [Natrialba magadii ATCC 43099]|uniref:E-NPP family protein n=1 Tax=Natrialba magadii (strain ATCC 43099 / DSM 3394 / CCM 3739 / CIP 104546 / IAM 13178 / JCM 8861 / NBRC 102185 / NCIMB 2190 / MS3) TaxID=547559 RepID=D3T002_NATMM|nr:nucleotide pyrophosphatase/phosphodiesterase family protein [Natrialba magadii]ADD04360.1 E-NPP family protein [Natrialba magadii ATCC 43099]ELY26000.1 type I phosphodiesterase/nucleotide pyrophosphatase [Natrialba magadii ATCC 43099]
MTDDTGSHDTASTDSTERTEQTEQTALEFDSETIDSTGRLIVLDVVGLQPQHIDPERTPTLHSLFPNERVTDLRPPFPALTVPTQTTLATGTGPSEHGDVSSGEFDRERRAAEFWERDRADRNRIWETASEAGLTTGALFFQHLIGTSADVAVTPSPIEDEDNNLIEMNCWTNPNGFYDDLQEAYAHFPLHNYWGPGANEEGSQWILSAAREAVERFDPDLLWVYVPHLDYVGQSDGPSSDAFDAELETVDEMLGDFLDFLSETDRWDETAVNLLSEYGFHDVEQPVFPNRALHEAGLLETDAEGDADIPNSAAFAMVDHQIAHVYLDTDADAGADAGTDDGANGNAGVDGDALESARELLADLDGVATVIDDAEKAEWGIDHPNAGDFVLVAEPDAWFQYYWWTDHDNAPPYATDMDIHDKPGFDPCELFFGEEGMVSLDPSTVSGSHGRVDESAYGCYALGGPAARDVDLSGIDAVDATAVTPTIEAVLEYGTLDQTAE